MKQPPDWDEPTWMSIILLTFIALYSLFRAVLIAPVKFVLAVIK